MGERNLKSRIIHLHDTEANWNLKTDFIPKIGEFVVYDKDTNFDYERVKIGDGTTILQNLPFILENELNGVVYAEDGELAEPAVVPYDADTLGGVAAENYALKTDIPEFDDTLSIENCIADAKVVGDALATKAPAGYGLGGNAATIESADDIIANGYYETAITTHGYTESCIVWHNQHSANYAEQSATSILGSCVGSTLHRTKINGTWQPWEWVNPPMEVDVIYRTTERYKGKPVYTTCINCGNLPNNTTKYVSSNAAVSSYGANCEFFDIKYRVFDAANNMDYVNPYTFYNKNGTLNLFIYDNDAYYYVMIITTFDASSLTCFTTVKFIMG